MESPWFLCSEMHSFQTSSNTRWVNMEGKTDDISYSTSAWRDLGLERKEWRMEVKRTSGVLASESLGSGKISFQRKRSIKCMREMVDKYIEIKNGGMCGSNNSVRNCSFKKMLHDNSAVYVEFE